MNKLYRVANIKNMMSQKVTFYPNGSTSPSGLAGLLATAVQRGEKFSSAGSLATSSTSSQKEGGEPSADIFPPQNEFLLHFIWLFRGISLYL